MTASKTAQKGNTTRAASGLFVVREGHRPSKGARLFAHTSAALNAIGMLAPERPVVHQRMAIAMIGQRAVTYHRGQHNFEDAANDGLRLTNEGYAKFSARDVQPGMFEAFMDLFTAGKAAQITDVPQRFVEPLAV